MYSPPPSRSPSPLFDAPASRNSSVSSASSGCEPVKVAVQLPKVLPRRTRNLENQHASEELQVDEALLGVPLAFVRDALRKLGPSLLASSNSTRPILPLGDGPLPSRLAFEPPPAHLPLPTHLLALHFRDKTSQHILLPTHGLPLALASPLLTSLSAPDSDPFASDTFSLPVVPLCMPAASTFLILHDYLLLGDLDILFAAIERLHTRLASPPDAFASRKAAALHGLWSNVVALEMEDEALWERLQHEWEMNLRQLSAEV